MIMPLAFFFFFWGGSGGYGVILGYTGFRVIVNLSGLQLEYFGFFLAN